MSLVNFLCYVVLCGVSFHFCQTVVVFPIQSLLLNEMDAENIEIYNYGDSPVDLRLAQILTITAVTGQSPTLAKAAKLSGTLSAKSYLHVTRSSAKRRKRSTLATDFEVINGKDFYGILIYNAPNRDWVGRAYATLDLRLIQDAALYTDGNSGETPFSSLIPWTGSYLPYTSGTRFTRCKNARFAADSFAMNVSATYEAVNDNCPVNPGGNGDPHFIQQIRDSKTNSTFNICYDIYGESGYHILILKDSITRTKIEGVLKDDFYMHEIHIIHSSKLLRVSTNQITLFDNKTTINWKNQLLYSKNDLVIRIDDNEIHLTIETNMGFNLKILVTRTNSITGGMHLNIQFKDIHPMEIRYSGLIGNIGKKSFVLKHSVQENQNPSMKIGKSIVVSHLQQSHLGQLCWFLPVQDVIHPNKMADFVYKPF